MRIVAANDQGKMEAARSSERLVPIHPTRLNNQKTRNSIPDYPLTAAL